METLKENSESITAVSMSHLFVKDEVLDDYLARTKLSLDHLGGGDFQATDLARSVLVVKTKDNLPTPMPKSLLKLYCELALAILPRGVECGRTRLLQIFRLMIRTGQISLQKT